uniref:Uncharacterized protein n=1 Tax=Rhizophora mucronata TaxID=61149 RepID=A0A2P2PX99_RHIMU
MHINLPRRNVFECVLSVVQKIHNLDWSLHNKIIWKIL